jgi:tetratricopeptide (TPR) repeat protein
MFRFQLSFSRRFNTVLPATLMKVLSTVLSVLLPISAGVLAQAQHQHGPEPDKTALDLAKLPAPQHLDGIGHAHIAITTKSPEAQLWFDQGLALLHCFWDYEALRAFEHAAGLDPECAMCHWGLSRALAAGSGHKDQVKQELKRAEELAPKASDHEQRYIAADAAAEDKKDDEAEKAFAGKMEALIDRYPDDLDAKLFYALSLNHGYATDGDPRSGSLYGQTVLREILQAHPDNAAANHYWIHAVEGSAHPEWALESANKLGSLAPNSGHMVHMPGHIFYRTGDYERARQIFLDSMRVDREYMDRQHVNVKDDWNYAHNISYLIADCAEEGRYKEAQEHARLLQGLSDDPDRSGAANFYVLQIGSTEERLAVRFGKWDEAISHPLQFGVPDEKLSVWARSYRDGLLSYTKGMKRAEAGQLQEADRESGLLDALLWRLSKEEADDENKRSRDQVLKLLGTASLELRGEIEARKENIDEARKLLEEAVKEETELGYSEPPRYSRPPAEVLGDVLIRAGKFSDARAAYRKELAERPNSGFALHGIALSWEKEGNRAEAAKAYREFLTAWSHADPELSQVKRAQAYLSQQTVAINSH